MSTKSRRSTDCRTQRVISLSDDGLAGDSPIHAQLTDMSADMRLCAKIVNI